MSLIDRLTRFLFFMPRKKMKLPENILSCVGFVWHDSTSHFKDYIEQESETMQWKYGFDWFEEITSMPKQNLIDILQEQNIFNESAKKSDLAIHIRSLLTVIDFNNQYKVGDFIGWKQANLAVIEKAQVIEPCVLVNGVPHVTIHVKGEAKAKQRVIDGYNLLYLIK